MIRRNKTYLIENENHEKLVVTPVERTPKKVVTPEEIVESRVQVVTEEQIREVAAATGKDPIQVEYELKKQAYEAYEKEKLLAFLNQKRQ